MVNMLTKLPTTPYMPKSSTPKLANVNRVVYRFNHIVISIRP